MFCRKCGTKMPEDSQFCLKCGVAVIVPSVNGVSPTGAATGVAPALELDAIAKPTSQPIGMLSGASTLPPSETGYPSTVDPLNGIRGWLLLFCLGLVLIQPLALFFEALNSGDAFVGGFDLVFAAFAIYTGIVLWRVATKALRAVKVYFVAGLVMATIAIVGGILTAPAAVASTPPSQDNFLAVGIRMLIGVAIWWSYFKKSKRVKATYGANL
jgi:hypothetical protein